METASLQEQFKLYGKHLNEVNVRESFFASDVYPLPGAFPSGGSCMSLRSLSTADLTIAAISVA